MVLQLALNRALFRKILLAQGHTGMASDQHSQIGGGHHSSMIDITGKLRD